MSDVVNRDKELVHADPNCTGHWTEVSARNTKGIKGRKGRFYWCPGCKSYFPVGEGYDRAYIRDYEMRRHIERAMMEQRATRAMVGGMVRFGDVDRERAEELADAALRGLHRRHFRVDEDRMARWRWRDAVSDLIADTTKRVREVLDGAFGSFRIPKIYADTHEGGSLVYVVDPEETPSPETRASIASVVGTIEPPEPFESVEVWFKDEIQGAA